MSDSLPTVSTVSTADSASTSTKAPPVRSRKKFINGKNYQTSRNRRPVETFSTDDGPLSVLVATDFHGRDRDFSTVRGFREHFERNVNQLIDICKDRRIDILILMGDSSDCGYLDKTIMVSHYNLWQRLANSVRYIASLAGNHMFIERDSNLELMCLQPHVDFPTEKPFLGVKPIFYNPEALIIDNVQFSLFNYNKRNKQYVYPKLNGIKTHIGLYHDESVVPTSIRKDMHIPIRVNSGYLADTYRNIDHAVLAHIHASYPQQELYIDNRKVLLDVPGSMCITENSDTEKHDTVKLPHFIIDKGTIQYSYINFDVGMEHLRFVKSAAKSRAERKDFSMIDPNLKVAISDKAVLEYTSKSHRMDYMSYLRSKGYTEDALDLVKSATQNSLTLMEAIEGTVNQTSSL